MLQMIYGDGNSNSIFKDSYMNTAMDTRREVTYNYSKHGTMEQLRELAQQKAIHWQRSTRMIIYVYIAYINT